MICGFKVSRDATSLAWNRLKKAENHLQDLWKDRFRENYYEEELNYGVIRSSKGNIASTLFQAKYSFEAGL